MAVSSLLPATYYLQPSSSTRNRIYDAICGVSFSRITYPTLTSAHSGHYNVRIIVEEDEPEEKLINRFKIEVLRARVFQECKRKRFFENKQNKIKRKARQALITKRNLQGRLSARFHLPDEYDSIDFPSKEKDDNSEDEDNWEIFDVDVPYA